MPQTAAVRGSARVATRQQPDARRLRRVGSIYVACSRRLVGCGELQCRVANRIRRDMKNSIMAALDLALTLLFIIGGLLLFAAGIWEGVFAKDVTVGIVLAVIGAALAGTPISRMASLGGAPRSERRLQWIYMRTGATPPQQNPTGTQTTLPDD